MKYIYNKFKSAVFWKHIDSSIQNEFNQLTLKKQKIYFINNTWGFILTWFYIVFALLSIFGSIFFKIQNPTVSLWYKNVGTFTVQSNILVAIFFVWYFWNPQNKIFKNYHLIVALCAYITITFIGYNFFIGIRIKFSAWTDNTNAKERIDTATSIWNHILAPIIIVAYWMVDYYYFKRFYQHQINKQKMFKYKGIIGFGLIFPSIFLIYALAISLDNVFVVYNGFTNLNPNLGYDSSAKELLVVNGNSGRIFNSVNDGSHVGKVVEITDELRKNFTFGKVFNIVYYIVFYILFALFLFIYRISFNWLFYPELKNKVFLKNNKL